MHWKFAWIKSDRTAIVKEWSSTLEKMVSEVRVELTLLMEEAPQLIIYPEDFPMDILVEICGTEQQYCVAIPAAHWKMDEEDFAQLGWEQSYAYWQEVSRQWVLSHNLSTIENLMPTLQYLRGKWKEQRAEFFLDVWQILRLNLGAQDLRIFYYDVDESVDKKKLVVMQVKQQGFLPQTIRGNEAEQKLLAAYETRALAPFDLLEFQAEKGEWVGIASVRKDPILLMAKVYQKNRLQMAVVKALWEGLQLGSF